MSHFFNVTPDQAQAVVPELNAKLRKEFNEQAFAELFTKSFSLKRISMAEFGVVWGLKRQPTAEEKVKLPNDINGVKISYEVK